MELKIEYLDKTALKPYVNNAKIHTDGQVEQIRKSIEEFDFNDPIAVWGENEIVEGHGRLLAAMEMDDIDTVPVIRLDHLTDKQRKAYALAHNKLTMNTDFDLDLLAQEVADLDGTLDLTDFGFNEAEILELTINDSPVEIPNAVPAPAPVNEEQGCTIPQFAMPVYNPADYEAGTAEIPQYQYNPINQAGESELTKEDINYYAQRAEQRVTRRVIIVYSTDEEEAYLKQLLAQETEKPLGVVLDVKNVMRKREQGNAESEK